jgi:hypothetical protein
MKDGFEKTVSYFRHCDAQEINLKNAIWLALASFFNDIKQSSGVQ